MGRQGLTRREALRLGAATAGTAVVFACAPASTSQTSPPGASKTPKLGGEIRIAGSAALNPAGYDPHRDTTAAGARPLSLMFEGLTQITGADYVPKPLLAESWTASADSTVWTFKIRKGVTFHNGRTLVADDVKYSFERILDPATAHPTRATYANIIAKIDAADTGTAIFTLKGPYAAFATLVSAIYQGCSIVPKEEVAKGSFSAKPVGTGPFKFKEQIVGEYVLMEKHPGYWMSGLPRLNAVRVLDITDQQAIIVRLRAGDIDLAYDVAAENYSRFKTDPQFDVYGGTGSGHITWGYLRLNHKSPRVPALADVRVRQAINWALDRPVIVELALPGLAEPLYGGFLPPTHWAALKEPVYPKRDLAKAKQLLAAAGYANGFNAKLETIPSLNYFTIVMQAIQQQLKEVGINLELGAVQTRTAQERPSLDMHNFGSAGTPDPDGELANWWLPGGASNWYGWEDPKVTELARQARTTVDQATRAKLYQEIQKHLAENSNAFALFQYNKYDVAVKAIKDYPYFPSSRDIWSLRTVWLDK